MKHPPLTHPVNVFLVCSGLGHINRGFESFTQDCFAALVQRDEVNITLFKGGGQAQERESVLWNLPRDRPLAQHLGSITGRGNYFVEQVSFVLSLLPHIQRQQPDLIVFSDGVVGNVLWHWRRLTRQSFKLLLSNGGPYYPPLLPHCDHIQQVVPTHYQAAVDAGVPATMQTLLPYGLHIPNQVSVLSDSDRQSLRQHLGLPIDRPIVLSVGAINTSHKRMDYVIRAIAALPEPRPYLLLLGQQDFESANVIQLGQSLLGTESFQVKTVALEAIAEYYQCADLFVLASLGEGFGRVFLEAMSYGLPCLAHDYEVARFVLGDRGYFANLELPDQLSGLIAQVLEEGNDLHQRQLRHRSIYERFSWDRLCPAYIDLIRRVAGQPLLSPVVFVA